MPWWLEATSGITPVQTLSLRLNKAFWHVGQARR